MPEAAHRPMAPPEETPMEHTRLYDAPGITPEGIAGMLEAWFRQDRFETQSLRDEAGRTIVQARKESLLRSVAGLSSALTVTMTRTDTGKLAIDLSGAAWANKVFSGTLALVLVHPLIISTAYGAWKQSQLDERVFAQIDRYIVTRTGQSPRY